MGRATRWLKGLLGGKKQAKSGQKPSNSATEQQPAEEKKRQSFSKPSNVQAMTLVPECSRWPIKEGSRGHVRENKERGTANHAVAVAAATAAAADAAAAAAQAAAEVVRLTTCGLGRERRVAMLFGGRGEWWAAVSIQTAFRGFLARKAVRALKALVKLQALVRGFLVRKQAAATLHCMEALVRAQVTVRMQWSGLVPAAYEIDYRKPNNIPSRHHPSEIRPRRSLERLDDTKSENATASFHSRRLSANLDHVSCGFDESPKIVEVDPGRPNKLRINRRPTVNVNPPPAPSTEEYSTTDDTPRSRSSPALTIHTSPSRFAIPSADPLRVFSRHELEWEVLESRQCQRRLPATAHNTPRLPGTSPAKSACGPLPDVEPLRWQHGHQHQAQQQHQLDYHHPRFMAGTQSSKAKARSQSAPKQRPDPRRRLTLDEMMDARTSLSGVRMQRSCSRAQESAAAVFKGGPNHTAPAVPRSCELGKGTYETEFLDHLHHLQLQRRW